jgi:putative pyruvate formate lyase activating enzyme
MNTAFRPAYLACLESGQLSGKVKHALTLLDDCTLCPRDCHVNRTEDETGICKTGRHAVVSSIHAHFGEEPPLVGTHGSGTIFFTHCNLMCNFCQNWDISHEGHGDAASDRRLAEMMLALQERGCHNINFVSPSHVVPQILASVEIAAETGLTIPLVYNSGGYDKVETLKLLDGVIDIYMPDFKFWDSQIAEETCDASDYPVIARDAISEMHRQTGDLLIGENGLAQRGLIVRHLVMPGDLSGTRQVMRFIAGNISVNTYVNVMAQYRPEGEAGKIPELAHRLSAHDYHRAMQAAREEGIVRFAR